jgi:hypothetical protein
VRQVCTLGIHTTNAAESSNASVKSHLRPFVDSYSRMKGGGDLLNMVVACLQREAAADEEESGIIADELVCVQNSVPKQFQSSTLPVKECSKLFTCFATEKFEAQLLEAECYRVDRNADGSSLVYRVRDSNGNALSPSINAPRYVATVDGDNRVAVTCGCVRNLGG